MIHTIRTIFPLPSFIEPSSIQVKLLDRSPCQPEPRPLSLSLPAIRPHVWAVQIVDQDTLPVGFWPTVSPLPNG
jgi:hypothetical protein